MNRQFRYIASAMIVGLAGSVITSCDDWTEPESIDIDYITVDKTPTYAEYCANLRAYRASDHRKVYAWMNIPATGPTSQAYRLTALPDSTDVVVLDNPSEIHAVTLEDMAKVRAEKGMEVIYTIDFDAIKAAHTTLCELNAAERTAVEGEITKLTADYEANENKDSEAVKAEYEAAKAELQAKLDAIVDPEINDYVLENLTTQLSYAKKNGLDGVMFAFNGKSSSHMTPAQLAEYNMQQAVFLGAASDWHKRNPGLSYDFLGYPQNVTRLDLLDEFRTIFIRQGLDATNGDQFDFYYTQAMTQGVPAERLGMVSVFPVTDNPADDKTGYLTDGTLAINALTKFASSSKIAAVGVYNIQRDYFSAPADNFRNLRDLIQTVNPSIQ